MGKSLLKPGTLVTGKTNEKTLYLWHSCESDDEAATPVNSNELLIIIETKVNESESLLLTPEWQLGAYLVMSSQGQKGWLGEGWVKLLSN